MNEEMSKDEMLLLANPKKLQRAQSANNVSTNALYPVRNCFQILESVCLKDPTVQTYPKEFADFIKRNTPEIIAGFKRSLMS